MDVQVSLVNILGAEVKQLFDGNIISNFQTIDTELTYEVSPEAPDILFEITSVDANGNESEPATRNVIYNAEDALSFAAGWNLLSFDINIAPFLWTNCRPNVRYYHKVCLY